MSKEIDKGMTAVSPVEGGRRPTGTGETEAAPKRVVSSFGLNYFKGGVHLQMGKGVGKT